MFSTIFVFFSGGGACAGAWLIRGANSAKKHQNTFEISRNSYLCIQLPRPSAMARHETQAQELIPSRSLRYVCKLFNQPWEGDITMLLPPGYNELRRAICNPSRADLELATQQVRSARFSTRCFSSPEPLGGTGMRRVLTWSWPRGRCSRCALTGVLHSSKRGVPGTLGVCLARLEHTLPCEPHSWQHQGGLERVET